jgi:formylglycine-generating enzyme required for sulfatase activity
MKIDNVKFWDLGEVNISHSITSTPTPSSLENVLTKVSSVDGMTMVYIPSGEFNMGSNHGEVDEKPYHTVYLDSFWIDEHEVTNAQFAAFLNEKGNQIEGGESWLDLGEGSGASIENTENGWKAKLGYEYKPISDVTWYGAKAYCQWADRRLPTEAEWEKAARGGMEGKKYPWGNEEPECSFGAENGAFFMECSLINLKLPPVKRYQPNGYGVYDMAGSLSEWVSDWYSTYYYVNSPDENPQGPQSGQERVYRGGSRHSYPYYLRVAVRGSFRDDKSSDTRGFRCVQVDD